MYVKFQDDEVKHVQNRVVFFYSLTCFLVIVGSCISLYSEWKHLLTITGKEMVKDNLVYQNLVRSTITDSLRLIQISIEELEHSHIDILHDRSLLQTALKKSRKTFTISNKDRFGLLMITDADGLLIARSDEPLSKSIDFSDRYWFQQIKNHPDAEFAVGPLLRARTTNKLVAHISRAIKDRNGKLIGVMVLQIDPYMTQAQIENVMPGSKQFQRTVLNQSGEIFWSQPEIDSINSEHGIKCTSPEYFLKPANKGWTISRGELISRTSIPEMGLHTISTRLTKDIYKNFIYDNLTLILYGLLTFIPFSYLVRKFYLQIGELELVRFISNTDALTEISNRLSFDKNYDRILGDARRNNRALSVLFIDIDNFKICNDTYGHDNGDIVLKSVANTIKAAMKRPLDLCARWGGEEFVAILPDTDQKGAIKIAEAILHSVRTTKIAIKDHPPINVTVSIGIASAEGTKESFDKNLTSEADQAMYRAKRAGRNRYSI